MKRPSDSGRWTSDVISNVVWGIRQALPYAVLFSALVVILVLAGGFDQFRERGVEPAVLVGAYFGVALFAGTIVGLLRRFTRGLVGSLVVGIVATFPVAVGIAAMARGGVQDLQHAWVQIAIVTTVFGVGGAIALREWARYDRSRDSTGS